jgi:hypothetical protein
VRGIWQLALASAVVGAVLVVSGFLLLESGGGDKKAAKPQTGPTTGISYGSSRISAQALGGPYQRTVFVQFTNKRSGAPLRGAKVTIHGEMTLPHVMRLYDKRLPEVARGEYKGPYTLIMPGNWRVIVIATSKKGDTSTYALPVDVRG